MRLAKLRKPCCTIHEVLGEVEPTQPCSMTALIAQPAVKTHTIRIRAVSSRLFPAWLSLPASSTRALRTYMHMWSRTWLRL